jgi:hypothetical protein
MTTGLHARRVMTVPHDGQQPGFCVVAAQRIEPAVCAQDRVLHDVIDTFRRARQPAREPVRGVEMGHDLRLEASAPVIHRSKPPRS